LAGFGGARLSSARLVRRHPGLFYGGGIFGITAALSGAGLAWAMAAGWSGPPLAGLFVCLALAASQVAVSVINGIAPLLVGPRVLPRLDFAAGVPAEYRTMVVVPTMLTDAGPSTASSIVSRSLSRQPGSHVHFALLTDFRDARPRGGRRLRCWTAC
jgi:hypothetical protein